MPKRSCWAACLGDCEGSITGEHLVSRGVVRSDSLQVKGLSWCREEFKEIGVNSFVANILCERHNNALSPVDSGGKAATDSLHEMDAMEAVRRKMPPRRWQVVRRGIDGWLLERWLIKTAINLLHATGGRWGLDGAPPEQPPELLVRAAFGHTRLQGPMGTYTAIAEIGQRLHFESGFRHFGTILRDGAVAGCYMKLVALELVLWLSDETPDGIRHQFGWGSLLPRTRNTSISIRRGKHISQVVELDWGWPNRFDVSLQA